jgi:hypothetical protein
MLVLIHDLLLTEWEQEIVELPQVTEPQIRGKLANVKSFYRFILIFYFHIPIKPKFNNNSL